MKKLTKKSLDELEKVMPVICESKQREFVGGGSGTNCDPYTYEEFERMLSSGTWQGGYVLFHNSSEPIYTTSEVTSIGNSSKVFSGTGNDTYDIFYRGGYELGYKAGLSTSGYDDIGVKLWAIITGSIAGDKFGEVDYEMIWYSNGIKQGYQDGLKDKNK